jgi:thiol-disulfide isomerase/thioredoxin
MRYTRPARLNKQWRDHSPFYSSGFYSSGCSRIRLRIRVFVTYSNVLNLFGMHRNIPILVGLALTAVMAANVAQASPNHLSGQKSAYLTRAVSQQVDWYPWGAAAFERAKELNRPILLDVGAVWCPWCDRMDRDTYTNHDTADFINQHFVAVKVDFDTSPALVAQLQRAQAILNLPAGLPLTSFITPDGKLYLGAGYLAEEHKGGKPSFQEAAEEAVMRFADKSRIEKESFQLKIGDRP